MSTVQVLCGDCDRPAGVCRCSKQRYEIVGLTKAEAQRALETLIGCPIVNWHEGEAFAITRELKVRPMEVRDVPA